jgi:hypothetical protein
METDKMVRRGITLSEVQWRRVKSEAAQNGLTISGWISLVIQRATPNHALFIDPDGTVRDPTK